MTTALPDGTCLLHIGPHKTGTTTIQAAFDQNRETLEAQDVCYVSPSKHPMTAALAVAHGTSLPTTSIEAGMRRWHRLVQRTQRSSARINVISSEFISDARPERIRSIVDDLGPRTHVVITLRPLIRILASQWQQYMQNRPALNYDDSLDYEGWLDQILNHADERPVTPSFWKRHDHGALVERWVEALGVDRITVVVVDERDKRMLLRSFEELVGVSEGTLEPREIGANRSLTVPEITLLRAVNVGYLAGGWGKADYTRFFRFGAIRHLQERRPAADEPKLLTPQWAVDRAVQHSAGMVTRIRETGVPVIGDLDTLADPALAVGVGSNQPAGVPAEIAARLAAGVVRQIHEIPGRLPKDRSPGKVESRVRQYRIAQVPPELDAGRLGTGRLLRIIAGRLRRRLRSTRRP